MCQKCTVSQQADKKILEEKEDELKKEMTSLKERNHSLEQMVNELLSKGDGDLISVMLLLTSTSCFIELACKQVKTVY